MGEIDRRRATHHPPTARRAPEEGLENFVTGREKSRSVHIQLSLGMFQPSRNKYVDSPLIYAAYYVAFGPHGPRADLHPPGTVPKLILYVLAGVMAGGALTLASRAFGGSR